MLKYLYVTEANARLYGLTHEGTVFGLPVWLGDVDNDESVLSLPKVPAMALYLHAMSALYDLFCEYVVQDNLKIPLVIGRSIE
jgi:hypothetical protein